MKITIVSDMISPFMGGSEVYVTELSKELVNRGHKVTWVGMRLPFTEKTEINEDGVILKRLKVPFNERRLFCLQPELINIVKQSDVIQWNSFVAALTGGAISKLENKPHILLVHEFFQELWEKFSSNKIEKNLYPLLEKMIVKNNYNAVICPCDYTKNRLIKMGVNKNKIAKIPHGIDYEFFKPSHPHFREQFGLDDKFIIGWTGRMGFSGMAYSKNLKSLFFAFHKVKTKIPEAVLALSGTGFKNVEGYIKSLGLKVGKDVIYVGVLDKFLLPSFYSSLDVFASSSLSEGFGFSVVEAQSCGVPVVCFNAGSLPEVVSKNKTGKVLDKKTPSGLAKGIIELYKYPQVRERYSKETQNWVKQFDWKKSAKAHEKVYEDVYTWHKLNE